MMPNSDELKHFEHTYHWNQRNVCPTYKRVNKHIKQMKIKDAQRFWICQFAQMTWTITEAKVTAFTIEGALRGDKFHLKQVSDKPF